MALPLTPDVFRMLLAVGWSDGRLHDDEVDAVLRAARAEGFEQATLDELHALSRGVVTFGDVDTSELAPSERLYVYGVASWVARCDEVLSPEEWAALHAIATVAESDRPVRLDLEGLKTRIGAKLAEVAAGY